MSDPGDYRDEMERLDDLTDREIDTLLAGKTPREDGDLARLASLVEGVRMSCIRSLDPEREKRDLAMIVNEARLEADRSHAATAPTEPQRTRTERRKPRWARIAVAAGAVVFATGGLAAADVLPSPAQDAVASVAEHVGLNLPSSDDAEPTVSPLDDDESLERTGDSETRDGDHSKSVADDVHDAIDNSNPGPGRGKAVSDAANQNRRGPNESPGASHKPTSTPEHDGGEDNSGPSENSGPSANSGSGSSHNNSGPSGSDD